ncbi:MAG: hypothetical protein U0270_17690 [Labilithrix sp.]
MTRETADALWGAGAVDHALRYETPEKITTELNDEVSRRNAELPPGAFRAWTLTQPWPRFCSIVWIISGALRERLASGDFPKTLLGENQEDQR